VPPGLLEYTEGMKYKKCDDCTRYVPASQVAPIGALLRCDECTDFETMTRLLPRQPEETWVEMWDHENPFSPYDDGRGYYAPVYVA